MIEHEVKNLLDDAAQTLNEAVDVDTAYWTALAVGQDTQEAESSGFLCGYAEALQDVRALVVDGNPDKLNLLVQLTQVEIDDRKQQLEEMEED